MDEDHPFAVCVREVRQNASRLFADAEVVSKKRHHERGGVARPRVLDTLCYRVHVVRVHTDIECEKRVHPGIGPELPLDPSQERLCRIDVVFVPKEAAQRTRKVVDVDLATFLLTQYVVEIERLVRPHQIEEKPVVGHVPQPLDDQIA